MLVVKYLFICILLLLCFSYVHAQEGCDVIQFKKLSSISKEKSITDTQLGDAVQLLKKLEHDKCLDYIGKNGRVITGRTNLFAKICLINNSQKSVKEYIEYLKRQHGSAEEQLSFSFERIFAQRPEDVLSFIRNDHDLLNQLGWGFANNHSTGLTAENCKNRFFQVNPKMRAIYPRYKKEIDYLINDITEELKG